MSEKRNCRRTPEEIALHKEATRLRRLSDKQLVEAFHRAKEPRPTKQAAPGALEKVLAAIAEGKCKGVGSGTIYKITSLAEEMGLL